MGIRSWRQGRRERRQQSKPQGPPHERLFPQYIWLEPLAGGAIGGLLYLLHSHELGELTWIISIFLMLGRVGFSLTIAERMRRVDRMADIIDMSLEARVPELREMVELYYHVVEPEFAEIKNSVIGSATEELQRIANQKRSVVLSTGPYYGWLLPTLANAPNGSEIWAISMMMSCEWTDTEAERKFLQGNIAASKRGVSVRRIFIVPESEMMNVGANRGVSAHADPKNRLQGHIITREELSEIDRRLLTDAGDGLLAFGEHAALIDAHSTDGSARGYVTMNVAELRKWRKTFDDILPHCEALVARLVRLGQYQDSASRRRNASHQASGDMGPGEAVPT